ncbi:predicted protein [Botrytis cinerea T4]|uniref:Uncharacterized protein n=1 Tax=Botryotinia fuckeliana (strain T4) TaxID=999810 RepID=G2YNT5_BOTF4|nr:predicted protein [Botrytis cinerea T4]
MYTKNQMCRIVRFQHRSRYCSSYEECSWEILSLSHMFKSTAGLEAAISANISSVERRGDDVLSIGVDDVSVLCNV